VKTSVPAKKDMVNGSSKKINNNIEITTTLAMMKFLTVTVLMLKKVQ
jgi:hypothetical protein